MERKIRTLKFDLENKQGKFKILNATGGGPWYKRYSSDQLRSNFKDYQAARIPYQRNHDLGHNNHFAHDVSQIFRNFDADENDPESYDFAVTDEYILATLDAGTKTFYRLGESIDHDIKKHRTYPPKDFHKWARICEHIIRHYTEGWADGYHLDMPYWEIWNEPDLGPQCWIGTQAEFFDFFEIAAKHLKSCFPHLKIGGPAVTGGGDEWAKEFLFEMKKRNVPMDFFSWHAYRKTPDNVMRKAAYIKSILMESGYTETESILNEWNYVRGWSEDFQYSINAIHGAKGGSFIMGMICESQASSIDMLMYYDTRRSAFNGVFDFYSYKPLKGYWALAWYGQNYYDLENYIPQKKKEKDLYTLCGTDKDGKITCIVTHYSENDRTKPKRVKLDFGRAAKFEAWLVDEDNDAKKIRVTKNLEFDMKVHSYILLKEI